MADQGASERRGTESAVTPVGQSSTLLPVENYGISYFQTGLQSPVGHDSASAQARLHETLQTQIGVGQGSNSIEVSPNQGTGYTNTTIGVKSHDTSSNVIRSKESQFSLLGVTIPETSSHGTSYLELDLGSPTALGGGTTLTTYYKLRARDSGNLGVVVYVYWVSTSPTIASYPGTYPNGGPGINLTVLDVWRQ